MRFSVLAAVAFSSLALAQSPIDQIPKCAQACFGNNLGTCGQSDIGCICGNTSVINSVSCCVFATCSQAEIASTIAFAVSLCKIANVNVNTQPSCPSGTAAVSSGGNSAASATASSRSGSAAASSGTPAASSGAPAASSGAPAASSGTPSASVARTGAAPVPTAGAGLGLGMAIAGIIAAL
ncbi:hypothetical protein GQ44DRAFT_698811 [Phaeosphaeriaceae sp. PMI808]|nr:hypothetical protein GQ44DRAFT_698811 [Phaeosphaeriaceae sp. PMI808]